MDRTREEEEDVPDTPPEFIRLLRATSCVSREEVRRDKGWYELGKNMEYLNGFLIEVRGFIRKEDSAARGDKRGVRLAHQKICEAQCNWDALNRKITQEEDERIDYLWAIREWTRIFDLVREVRREMFP